MAARRAAGGVPFILMLALALTGLAWTTACAATRDADTAGVVARTLQADAHLNPDAIRVEVVDGTAYLTGIASTPEQRARAERLARAVIGVRTVVNDIMVVPPAGEPLPSAFDEWARAGGP